MTSRKKHSKGHASPNAEPAKAEPQVQSDRTGPDAAEQSEPLNAEQNDLLARLQRLSADYLNYQKRAQRDLEQARQFANEKLIKDLLPVLDDMERATESARANADEDDPLLLGMQLVHDKILQTLGRFGLQIIEALDKPFDPEKHSAMLQQPSDEHPHQTVLKELQKGYELKGRTIRPCAVIVSTGPETPDDESGQSDADEDEPAEAKGDS